MTTTFFSTKIKKCEIFPVFVGVFKAFRATRKRPRVVLFKNCLEYFQTFHKFLQTPQVQKHK